jgi:hypothetical protein
VMEIITGEKAAVCGARDCDFTDPYVLYVCVYVCMCVYCTIAQIPTITISLTCSNTIHISIIRLPPKTYSLYTGKFT